MANWSGAARSNYVEIENFEGLTKALDPFSVEICEGSGENMFCFLSKDEDCGCWPGSATVDVGDGQEWQEEEVEFDPSVQICPFMKEGEILVMMETGSEKLRYLTGHANAYNKNGDCVSVSINDIYEKAAQAFSVPVGKISEATY
jgi:hypothetical protein